MLIIEELGILLLLRLLLLAHIVNTICYFQVFNPFKMTMALSISRFFLYLHKIQQQCMNVVSRYNSNNEYGTCAPWSTTFMEIRTNVNRLKRMVSQRKNVVHQNNSVCYTLANCCCMLHADMVTYC